MATPYAETDIADMKSLISLVSLICGVLILQFMMESKQLITFSGFEQESNGSLRPEDSMVWMVSFKSGAPCVDLDAT